MYILCVICSILMSQVVSYITDAAGDLAGDGDRMAMPYMEKPLPPSSYPGAAAAEQRPPRNSG